LVRPMSSSLSAAKLAANRRNALKSTGPRTAGGKRRAMLNAHPRPLPGGGGASTPDAGRRPARVLPASSRPGRHLPPQTAGRHTVYGVDGADLVGKGEENPPLGCRRPGTHGGAGCAAGAATAFPGSRPAPAARVVATPARSVLGHPLGSPTPVRGRIESRLFIFGAKPGRRTYPRPSGSERLLEEFQGTFGEIVAVELLVDSQQDGRREDGGP
jgi:hypothetical protein